MRKVWKLLISILIIVLVAGVGWWTYWQSQQPDYSQRDFQFVSVMRGNLNKIVTASGTINPVTIVNVGTQVSGKISNLYADYNSEVKKGQLLAKLDTAPLVAKVAESRAKYLKAIAENKLAKIQVKRFRRLEKGDHVSREALDKAEKDVVVTAQEIRIAKSQLENDKINLGYAYIYSPVSGVVISRNVDVGQTVAATFQTPTLFRIAEDLRVMQIAATVSEADIGMIKTGQHVKFTVDAFPDRDFTGTVRQVRLDAKSEQNVVVYDVIIDVSNPDRLLLPGMTAYVNIHVATQRKVLYVPNSALRFEPSAQLRQQLQLSTITPKAKNKIILYVWRNDRVVPVIVKKGLSTLTDTQIITNQLKVGDKLISGYVRGKK